MTVAARTIVELNIKHYRELLLSETDALKRQTVAKLLTEEEVKLAKLLAEKSGDARRHTDAYINAASARNRLAAGRTEWRHNDGGSVL